MRYSPSVVDTLSLLKLLSIFVATTWAPTTAELELSRTLPRIEPVTSARALEIQLTNQQRSQIQVFESHGLRTLTQSNLLAGRLPKKRYACQEPHMYAGFECAVFHPQPEHRRGTNAINVLRSAPSFLGTRTVRKVFSTSLLARCNIQLCSSDGRNRHHRL